MRFRSLPREVIIYVASMVLLLSVAVWLLIGNYRISANLYSKNVAYTTKNIELLTKGFQSQLDEQMRRLRLLTKRLAEVVSDKKRLNTELVELMRRGLISQAPLFGAMRFINEEGSTIVDLKNPLRSKKNQLQEVSVLYPVSMKGKKVGQLVVELALADVFDSFFSKHIDSQILFNLFYGGSRIHTNVIQQEDEKEIADQFTWKFDLLPLEMQWLIVREQLMDDKTWRYGIVLFVIIFIGAIAGVVGLRNLQHKRFRSSVIETEDAYLKIFYKSRDAMMILDHQKVVDCNAAALETFNASNKAELMFLELLQLSARVQQNGDTSVIALDDKLERLYARGDARFDWKFRRLGGDKFLAHVSTALIPFRGKKQTIMRVQDMSIEKAMEAALEEHEKFTDVIFESTPVGIVLVDAESEEIVKMNKAFAKLVEDREGVVEGNFLSDYFDDVDINSMYQRCRSNEMIQKEVVFENHNLVVTFLMIRLKDKPFFLVSFVDLIE